MPLNTVAVNANALADALRSLVATIAAALQTYEHAPVPGLELSAKKWRTTALPLLEADLAGLDAALVHPESAASLHSFVTIGGNETGLAKNLDSFRFDFAGPLLERQLNEGVDAVVPAASALVASIAALRGAGR